MGRAYLRIAIIQSSINGLKRWHFAFLSAIFRRTWFRTNQPDDEMESIVLESQEKTGEKDNVGWNVKRNLETSSPLHICPDPSLSGPLKPH
jgi:hypothetical protein